MATGDKATVGKAVAFSKYSIPGGFFFPTIKILIYVTRKISKLYRSLQRMRNDL